jgi:hypothetical protein
MPGASLPGSAPPGTATPGASLPGNAPGHAKIWPQSQTRPSRSTLLYDRLQCPERNKFKKIKISLIKRLLVPSVVEPHHFNAGQAPGKNFDGAPAPTNSKPII